MKKQYKLTQEGVDELRKEFESLVASRQSIAEAIGLAREQGDLSENAEYQAAKLEQERVESRISEIDNILKNVEIISQPKNTDKVRLGSKVILVSEDGKKLEFSIVGTVEADPLEGKISDESPIGQAIIGRALNDSVEIKTPSETSSFKINSIS